MSIIQGTSKAAGGGYTIDQSLRLNSSASAYLSKAFSSDGGDTYTISFWTKRAQLGGSVWLLGVPGNGGFKFEGTTDQFGINDDGVVAYSSAEVYRDPGAWMHICIQNDASTGTSIYVNNQAMNISSSANVQTVNGATTHYIGRFGSSATGYYDGYLADWVFLSDRVAAPTEFAEYDSNGVWVPVDPSGLDFSGTNSHWLNFADSANLGADASGNGFDFTTTNIGSDDQRADTPTNNMMTFNPLNNMRDDGDPTDGNRVFYNTGGTRNIGGTTFHFNTGKYVQAFSFDGTGTSNWQIGSQPSDRADVNDAPGSNEDLGEAPLITPSGTYYVGVGLVSTSNTGITADTADTIWVAMDLDSGKQWIGLYDDSAASMIWFDSSAGQTGDPAAGSNPVYTGTANRSYNFAVCSRSSTKITLLEESEATGTVPTGFTYVGAVQDTYATPAIKDGSAHFNTILYTGDGSATTRSLTGVGFQPDFVWKKIRSNADHHWLHDAVRGADKGLNSNRTDSEYTSTRLTSFDSDGFSFATSDPDTNGSGTTYVAWNWLAGNGTASNTDGSITSTVSANVDAGFSIVSWTLGSTDNQTVGHGLSAAPEFMFLKNRDAVGGWTTYHKDNTSAPETEYLRLDSSNATVDAVEPWNDTAPTSSVFTIGDVSWFGSASDEMIMYCFHEVEGFSKFGSYTGNGSADGPFVWTGGFRPAWFMTKRVDSGSESWVIQDTARSPYNLIDQTLLANATNAEISNTAYYADILSNGFKIRSSHSARNASGGTYIFAAFAEHPFGGDGVAPVPAR